MQLTIESPRRTSHTPHGSSVEAALVSQSGQQVADLLGVDSAQPASASPGVHERGFGASAPAALTTHRAPRQPHRWPLSSRRQALAGPWPLARARLEELSPGLCARAHGRKPPARAGGHLEEATPMNQTCALPRGARAPRCRRSRRWSRRPAAQKTTACPACTQARGSGKGCRSS